MKKNIFKKAGRVFTSLALAVSICLTMSVSVFAKNGNDLENKNINYRDYLYFVIDAGLPLSGGPVCIGAAMNERQKDQDLGKPPVIQECVFGNLR